jgi:hypothetical protein
MNEDDCSALAPPRSWPVTAGMLVRSILLAALYAGAAWLAFDGNVTLGYFAAQAPTS